jgi:hypothetical protein
MRPHRSIHLLFAFCAGLALHAQIQVVGSLTASRAARPNETYDGTIVLANAGTQIADAKVYLRDYVFTADGSVVYGEAGSEARSNAGWISYSPNVVSIPAGERAEVSYRVKVPAEPKLEGTYWSLILVEGVPGEAKAEETDTEQITLTFRQVTRYAIQIVTNIEGTGRVVLKFSNTRLLAKDGVRTLQVDVQNAGTLWTRPTFLARLYDMMGKLVGELAQPAKRLYPGTSVRAVFELPALEAGTYKALVVADGGNDDLFGANYTLKIAPPETTDQGTGYR